MDDLKRFILTLARYELTYRKGKTFITKPVFAPFSPTSVASPGSVRPIAAHVEFEKIHHNRQGQTWSAGVYTAVCELDGDYSV